MQTLQISEEKARKLYPNANTEWKLILEDSFGKEFFNQKITDRVKSFQDIISIAGVSSADYNFRPDETEDELAYRQAKLIATVLNEGTVLDPFNTSQYKYFPWFKITPGSGFGLSYCVYGGWCSSSNVGVRLCFKNESLAKFAGETFTEIYARLLIK